MARYLFGRILQGVGILLGVSVLTFLLVRLTPGDPGRLVLGPRATSAAVAHLDRSLGLDRSIPAQYLSYLAHLLRGNLGMSLTQHTSVLSIIAPRLAPTVIMVGYSLLLGLGVAVPLATIAAVRQDSRTDHAIRLGTVLCYAMPPFWFGLLLALVLGLDLHLFPTSGYDSASVSAILRTLTLPALTLAIYTAPVYVRTLRSSVTASLGSDFVEAARARGLAPARILGKHVLRNSLTATITLAGISCGTLLSLAVVVEQVFGIPGLGSELVQSVTLRDYPVVQGLALVFATAVVLANLAADILQAVVDPRVRL
jgi:peptide/nickel transport system permease protein